MYAIIGRRILIMAFLFISSSIAHADLVIVDWSVASFFNWPTGSLGWTCGIYQVVVLPVFPTPIDISQVTAPEPATLALLIIVPMGIGISRHISKIQGLSTSGFKVIENKLRVSASFTNRELSL
jgi:hypothetical protein